MASSVNTGFSGSTGSSSSISGDSKTKLGTSRKFDTMADKIFVGSFIHTNKRGELIIVEHGAIHVKSNKICNVEISPISVSIENRNVIFLSKNQFLIPGFVDCHIHAVQFPNLGIGYDKMLLEWLETYTFPLEKKYTDENFAEQVFKAVVKQTVMQGTTTACYFASLYSKASLILGQEAMDIGQRAFIGKLSMNETRTDNYYETTEDSIKNINKFIEDLNNLNSPLINPIITPRFALSCDMKLMKELGKLANEKNLHIQTHISENTDEVEAVKNKFPGCTSYAEVYDEAKLITNKTVLAHGIYLTDNELNLIKERNAAIVHCPSSNTCLKSGLCNIRKLKTKGIKIGLGTDVSGGQSSSILDAMKSALQVSNHLSFINENYETLDYKDVFHMATLGGAAALAIDNQIGNFEIGKEFDALIVDTDTTDGLLNNLQYNTLEEKFQKFIYSGDDRNIIEVYISGRKVK